MATKPPGRLQDKVAIVTGSSSGVGRAIAILYANEGAKVICADLHPMARPEVPGETAIDTHELIMQSGGLASFVACNVGIAADVETLVGTAVAQYGRLDVQVSALRYRRTGAIELMSPQHGQQCWRGARGTESAADPHDE